MTLLDSLLDAILRLDGEALIMHAGEKPYVVLNSASMNTFRGPLSWGQVELSSRPLTTDAVLGMLGQMLSAEQRHALDDLGAIEQEIDAPGHSGERFVVTAARGGDDVWVEVRRRAKIAEIPAAQAEAEPAAPVESEPVAHIEAEPVAYVEAEPVADAEPEPVAHAESGAAANAVSEPAAPPVNQPVPEPEPAIEIGDEPLFEIASTPAFTVQTEASRAPDEDEHHAAVFEIDAISAIVDVPTESAPLVEEPVAEYHLPEERVAEIAEQKVGEIAELRVGEIAEQRVGEIAELRVGEIAAQKVTELAQQRVSEIADQKIAEIAGQRVSEVAEQQVSAAARRHVAEIAGRTVAEIAEQHVAEIAGRRVSEVAEQHIAELARQTVGEVAEQRVAAAAQQHVAEIAGKKVSDVVEQHVAQLARQKVGEVAEQRVTAAAEQHVAEIAGKTVSEVAEHHVAELARQRVGEVAEQRVTAAAEYHVAEIAGRTVSEVAEHHVAELARKTVDEVAQRRVTAAAEQHVAEIAGRTVAEVAEQRIAELADRTVTEVAEQRVGEVAEQRVAIAAEQQVAELAGRKVTEFAEQKVAEIAERTFADLATRKIAELAARKIAEIAEEKFAAVARPPEPIAPPVPRPEPAAIAQPVPVAPVPVEEPIQVVVPHARPALKLQPQPPAPAGDASKEASLVELLRAAVAHRASTVYAVVDTRPMMRVDGRISLVGTHAPVMAGDVERFTFDFAPRDQLTDVAPEWTCTVPDVGRVRCVAFHDHSGAGLIFHLPPADASTADELGIPAELQDLASEADGLVVVAGPRSSGKSTLLGAFVDLINRTRYDHVITIESQIRKVHEKRLSFISQREVRGDGDAIAAAARAALREGPDVLVIEDLRSPEALTTALDAARAGRLVFGSISARTAPAAIQRLIDAFPADRRPHVRASLAGSLRAVIAQQLVPKAVGGRISAREVLLSSPAMRKLVLDGVVEQLPIAIESGRGLGMRTMVDSLGVLVRDGVVDLAEACAAAPDRAALVSALERDGIDVSGAERRA